MFYFDLNSLFEDVLRDWDIVQKDAKASYVVHDGTPVKTRKRKWCTWKIVIVGVPIVLGVAAYFIASKA